MIVRIPLKIFILRIHLSMLRFYHLQCFILNACRVADRHRMRYKYQKSNLQQYDRKKQNHRCFLAGALHFAVQRHQKYPQAIANSITATLPNA